MTNTTSDYSGCVDAAIRLLKADGPIRDAVDVRDVDAFRRRATKLLRAANMSTGDDVLDHVLSRILRARSIRDYFTLSDIALLDALLAGQEETSHVRQLRALLAHMRQELLKKTGGKH